MGLYRAASWGRILQLVLCGFHPTHSILLHRMNSILRIPSCGFHRANSIVQILLCAFHPTSSCGFYCEIVSWDCIMQIALYAFDPTPLYAFHRAHSILLHRVHSIVYIPLWNCVMGLHHANCIMRIASCAFHLTPLYAFHCAYSIVGLRRGIGISWRFG